MIGKNGKNNMSEKTLFLIDSKYPINELPNQIKNEKNALIISFDFETHKKLTDLGFEHKISDTFLTENEIDDAQHNAYLFAKWYENPEFKQHLLYENVNVAQLFHEQIVVFLAQFFKNFFEIKNIFNNYSNAKFFATSQIFQISKIFSDFGMEISQNQNNIEFAHDKVRYNIKIGKKYYLFLIPKNYYLKIKKISEFFYSKIFGFNKNIPKTDQLVLLVELHTTRFKELFLQSKTNPLMVYYGRRRPAIWDYESLSIFRKSKSKILTPDILSMSNIDYANKKLTFLLQFQKFWNDNEYAKNFFSLYDKSFWNILKPIWYKLIFSRIDEVIYEIELAKKIFETYKIKSAVVLSEVGMTEQIILSLAKTFDVPVLLHQIGHHYDTEEALETNISQSVYPDKASKFLVWGNISKNDAIQNGKISPDDLIPLGCPRYDGLFDSKTESNDYVLLATSGPREMHVRGMLVDNFENYEKSITEICKIVSKLGKKLVVKLHPGPNEYNITNIVKNINPDFEVVTTGDILPLIRSCQLMMVTGLSTSILEGQILQKPVISIPILDYKLGTPEIFNSKSCIVSNIDELENNLKKLFNSDDYRKQTLDLANDFLKNYFSNPNTASNEMLDYLSKS